MKKQLVVAILGITAFSGFGQTVGIFYNFSTPQHEFAANDIKTALEAKSFSVEFRDLSTLNSNYNGKKVVLALSSNTNVKELLATQGGSATHDPGEQAYALRTTISPDMSYWVVGGDDNGTMYGGLQIAENINFNGFKSPLNNEESPCIKNRGVKFNIPLDKESPTYYYENGGTSHKLAIENVWDYSFWTTWFDEMARNRYNVLSLWSPHPFTAMLNMENEYPGIAIQGVTGYDENGSPRQINNWTIDEKVAFWQRVMKYGKDRGFDIYFCTWNIFLSTAEGKYGLTDSPDNENTRTYLRKCMYKFLETYPDLTGFGITVGENMGKIDNKQKEEWAWNTYGIGMMEYAQANPYRNLVFIHRQHQGNVSDMLDYFKPLNDLPNVRFDLSFKYSQAHVHATVKPDFWDRRKMENGLGPNNLKSWLTIRNDDFYFLQWADPQFVRDYIKNFPDVDKFIEGFYIGADGWVFTREFSSKNPYYKNKNALSIQKTWYMQKLWGRISYNPSVSDELFKNFLKYKYPEVSSDKLFEAWSNASRAIQMANEQVTDTWDLDFKWYPEGWTSHKGFLSLEDTRKTVPMSGSNLCSISITASGNCGPKMSALTNSDNIEELAKSSLSILRSISSGSNTELSLNLKDIEAMAYLSLYNSLKFRAAVFLEQGLKDQARDTIGTACCFWKKYTNIMDELYFGADLQRNLDFTNWHLHDKDALQDYLNLGGKGEPNCTAQ